MKHNFKSIFVFLTAIISFSATAEISLLHGTVTDVNGHLIEGVGVSLISSQAKTDTNGKYILEANNSDVVRLEFSHPEFYGIVHTFNERDLLCREGNCKLPSVQLVRKEAGRSMLVFGGDAMATRRYVEPFSDEPVLISEKTRRKDMQSLLREVAPYLRLAEVASINLETPLLNDFVAGRLDKSVVFYTHPDIVPVLEWAGVDYVALGNNHIYDYGKTGLLNSLNLLQQSQLGFSGAGINEVEAGRGYSRENGSELISYFSYVGWPGNFSPNQVATTDKGGAALYNQMRFIKDLTSVDARSTVVVQVHDGLEYHDKPTRGQVSNYRGIIDHGGDLVIGHHPHILQGLSLYKNRLIAYSLGNFLFDQYIYSTQLSMLLFVWMDGQEFYRAEIVPIYLNGYMPTPAAGEIAFDILQRMARLSDVGLEFTKTGAHAGVMRRATDVVTAKLNVTLQKPGSVASLYSLRAEPLHFYDGIQGSGQRVRFGVDLLKRGSFEDHGAYGTTDRTWILSDSVKVTGRKNQKLSITGSARTGLKTFERAFNHDSPATVSMQVNANAKTRITVSYQRRPMTQTRVVALENGPVTEIGSRELSKGSHEVVMNFDMPRSLTKGIRLLIDVQQADDAVTNLDDIAWVEWTTPWLSPGQEIERPEKTQMTHVQLAP